MLHKRSEGGAGGGDVLSVLLEGVPGKEGEVYVVFDEESNEGWFDLEDVLEKGVFEIV